MLVKLKLKRMPLLLARFAMDAPPEPTAREQAQRERQEKAREYKRNIPALRVAAKTQVNHMSARHTVFTIRSIPHPSLTQPPRLAAAQSTQCLI